MVELVKEDGITPIRITTWSNLRSKIETSCPGGEMVCRRQQQTRLIQNQVPIGLPVQVRPGVPTHAAIAQMVEHWFEEPGVAGSIPVRCTNL